MWIPGDCYGEFDLFFFLFPGSYANKDHFRPSRQILAAAGPSSPGTSTGLSVETDPSTFNRGTRWDEGDNAVRKHRGEPEGGRVIAASRAHEHLLRIIGPFADRNLHIILHNSTPHTKSPFIFGFCTSSGGQSHGWMRQTAHPQLPSSSNRDAAE